jgi:hypothetical protein
MHILVSFEMASRATLQSRAEDNQELGTYVVPTLKWLIAHV